MTKINWNKARKYKECIPANPNQLPSTKWYERDYVKVKGPDGNRVALNREGSKSRKARGSGQTSSGTGEAPRKQIDQAIAVIQNAYCMRRKPKGGDYKDLEILTTIYQAARDLPLWDGLIVAILVKRTRADKSVGIFELLIRAALPNLPKSTRETWVGVMDYAAEAGVRPFKLGNFVKLKGGLVKCGATRPEARRQEIAKWKGSGKERSSNRFKRR